MRKKKKIAIVAIIVTILCVTFGALKIKEAEKIETISKNASEEKIQSNPEAYVQRYAKSKETRGNVLGDMEITDGINENVEDTIYEEGKAIIVYKSNSFVNDLKINANSVFNNYKIDDTIEFEKLGTDNSFDISVAVVSSDEYSTDELIEKLNEKSWVISAIPNYQFKTLGLTNDENTDIQWALQNDGQFAGTEGKDVNPITTSSDEEKVIAIVDTGVDYTNEDLVNMMWENPFDEETLPGKFGYDFANDDDDPMDDFGHGTHCAGIVAAEANNEAGISGAVVGSSNIKIMALKVGDAKGNMNSNDILSAYQYILQAQELGVNIVAINNSWGAVLQLGTSQDTAIQNMKKLFGQILEQLGENGALSVFAAGNNGLNLDENGVYNNGVKSYLAFPACLENDYEITVAATDSNDELAYFSNYGDVVDMAAPGVDIFSTYTSGSTFNPISSKRDEYCLYEDFEGDSSDVIDKISPYIISTQNGERVLNDASSICSLEVTDEKFYGDSGKALKISVDNSDSNKEVNLRFSLSELGIPDFSTYAISLDLYVIEDTNGAGTKLSNYGYTYNGGCLVSLENENLDFYYDLGATNICESGYWHHLNGVYLQNNYEPCEYLDVIIYNLGKGEYTLYIDNLVITNDLGDDYMQVLTPYELKSGTSMSAPYVTASAAVASNQYENYSVKEIKNLILNGTRDEEKFAGQIKCGELDMQSFLGTQEIGLVYGDSCYNYDGKEHTINLNVVKPTAGIEVYYSAEQELTTENYLSGNIEKPTFTNPGEYTVYWYVHSTNGEYIDRSGSCKVAIDNKIVIDGYNYKGKYDAEEHSISLYSDIQTSEVQLYYNTEQELTSENYNKIGNTIKPTFVDAGEYVVYWYAHSTNGVCEDVSGKNTVNIEHAVLALDLDNEYTERELTENKEGWNLIQLKLNNTCYTYTGVEIDPIGSLIFNGKELTKGKDYVITYYLSSYDEDNMPKCETEANPIISNIAYIASITGIGNFQGRLTTEEFTIEPRNITITANSQKILEGNQIKTGIDAITVGNGGLAEGQVISEITIESIEENGQKIIKASNAIIKDSQNNDVTSNYNISYVDGKLTTFSIEETVDIQFNDIGLYKSIILGNNIETLDEDEENKVAILEKNTIEQIESLVISDNYGEITDLTGLDSFCNLKSLDIQNINATYITEIEKILELPNITEVKINSSCELEELETNNDKMYLPQFLQEIAQTQSNSIITANIYYGEDNEIEIPVNKDDNGKLYVILDNKVSENKPAGDREVQIKVSGGITDGSTCSVVYTVTAPLTNFETIQIEEEEYILISTEDNNVQSILTQENFPNTNYEIRAIDIKGNTLTDNDKIGTGTKIEILSGEEVVQTYNIVIKGDIDCDGSIDLYDILTLIDLVFDTDSSYVWNECIRLAGKCAENSSTENPDLYDILRLIEYHFDDVKW